MSIYEIKREIVSVRLRLVYAHGIELTDLTVALDQLQASLILALEHEVALQSMYQIGRVA